MDTLSLQVLDEEGRMLVRVKKRKGQALLFRMYFFPLSFLISSMSCSFFWCEAEYGEKETLGYPTITAQAGSG